MLERERDRAREGSDKKIERNLITRLNYEASRARHSGDCACKTRAERVREGGDFACSQLWWFLFDG